MSHLIDQTLNKLLSQAAGGRSFTSGISSVSSQVWFWFSTRLFSFTPGKLTLLLTFWNQNKTYLKCTRNNIQVLCPVWKLSPDYSLLQILPGDGSAPWYAKHDLGGFYLLFYFIVKQFSCTHDLEGLLFWLQAGSVFADTSNLPLCTRWQVFFFIPFISSCTH